MHNTYYLNSEFLLVNRSTPIILGLFKIRNLPAADIYFVHLFFLFPEPLQKSQVRVSLLVSVKHIYKVDGLRGCYRGFYPWLSTNLLFKFTVTKVKENFPKIPNEDRDEDELTDDER